MDGLMSYQALLGVPEIGPSVMTSGGGFVRNLIRVGSSTQTRWQEGELNRYPTSSASLPAPRRAQLVTERS